MCGFLGLYSNTSAAQEVYEGLFMLQHRGQDAAGIYTFDGKKFHKKKGAGLVREIFCKDTLKRLKGRIAIGHVRYPTVGGGGVEDAQPFTTDHPYGIMMAHNGNLTNHYEQKKDLMEKELQLVNSDCDVEVLLHIFSSNLRKQKPGKNVTPEQVWKAVEGVFDCAKGAYSVIAYIANQGMVAFRDPHGIRPAIWGVRKKGLVEEHCFTSEKVVFDYLDFDIKRDLEPGEAVFIDHKRHVHTKVIKQKQHNLCIFEFIYLARPDSIIDKISVQKARMRMGKTLAKQIRGAKLNIDAIIPVPDSSRYAALGLATELKLPYREGFVKNRYVGRTFIMPGQDIRQKSIRRKLTTNIYEFKGKNVLLVDDSIVRGNTSRKIIQMVRDAGAKKVYLAISSPPLRSPCLYGIDLPTRKEYIANELSIDEIRKVIGADGLFYQDIDDLIHATRGKNKKMENFCTACLTGKYPTGDITEEVLQKAESQRHAYSRKKEDKEKPLGQKQMELI